MNFYFNILSLSLRTFQNTLQYGENAKLNLFDILWPEVRSESKKSELFLYRKERMINLGKQSGLIWSTKIRECLEMNICKCLPGGCSQVCTQQAYALCRGPCYWLGFTLSIPSFSYNHKWSQENSFGLVLLCMAIWSRPSVPFSVLPLLVQPVLAGMWPSKSLRPFLFHGVWNDRSFLLGGTLTVHLLLLCTPSLNSVCSLRYLNCLLW